MKPGWLDLARAGREAWMAGTSPAMTLWGV